MIRRAFVGAAVVAAALLAGCGGRGAELHVVSSGAFAAAYVTAGGAVRVRVSTTVYTAVCYPTCALLLLVGCLVAGQRLAGYDPGTWVKLAALTAGAQLLGHSLLNTVLRSTSPTVVSLAILAETPGAALIAAGWLGQVPAVTAGPGLVLLLIGVALVARAGGRAVPVE